MELIITTLSMSEYIFTYIHTYIHTNHIYTYRKAQGVVGKNLIRVQSEYIHTYIHTYIFTHTHIPKGTRE